MARRGMAVAAFVRGIRHASMVCFWRPAVRDGSVVCGGVPCGGMLSCSMLDGGRVDDGVGFPVHLARLVAILF